MNTNNNYSIDIIFTHLPKNTPDNLYDILDVNSLDFHLRAARKYVNVKAGIINNNLIYDGFRR